MKILFAAEGHWFNQDKKTAFMQTFVLEQRSSSSFLSEVKRLIHEAGPGLLIWARYVCAQIRFKLCLSAMYKSLHMRTVVSTLDLITLDETDGDRDTEIAHWHRSWLLDDRSIHPSSFFQQP